MSIQRVFVVSCVLSRELIDSRQNASSHIIDVVIFGMLFFREVSLSLLLMHSEFSSEQSLDVAGLLFLRWRQQDFDRLANGSWRFLIGRNPEIPKKNIHGEFDCQLVLNNNNTFKQ